MKASNNILITLLMALAALAAMIGCANPGSGPDGGPYDETPPRILSMQPAIGQTKAKSKKVTLTFDEYVKLEDAQNKIIVSPPQINQPTIRENGKRITVTLEDSLKDNSTYTIDFSDAIVDNNEGNPLGNFTYYFSTGSQLDTMEVSGNVVSADNLEPLQGVLVGLHSNFADSAFTRLPFDRVARTDNRGFFSIKGIAPGEYRIFALKDADGDFKFSLKGEMIAFTDEKIVPSSFPDIRHDTLWIDSIRYDSIKTTPYTHFMPDNIVLKAFQETGQPRHFLKVQRDVPEWFKTYFTAPSKQAPVIKGLNFYASNAFMQIASEGFDTITYWLRDTALVNLDTLKFTYSYLETNDSTNIDSMRTDTLELVPKLTVEKRNKARQKEMEKWEKRMERKRKRGDFSEETPPREYLIFKNPWPQTMSPEDNIRLTVSEPLARLDTTGIKLLLQTTDSTTTEAPFALLPSPRDSLSFTLMGEWRPEQKYKLHIDSAAFMSFYGNPNRPIDRSFAIDKNESFGTLFITLPGLDSTATVQIMRDEKNIYRQKRANKDGRVEFYYVKPDKYYVRLFVDRNLNGKWDPGNYAEKLQPEEVYYFPTKINVRENWDIDQTWNVKDIPLLNQKPKELLKVKDEKKTSAHARNVERLKNLGRQQ